MIAARSTSMSFRAMSTASLSQLTPFHLAFPVRDLERAKEFYGDVLGCPRGREDPGKWVDFDLFGHQIVCHQTHGDSPAGGVVTRNQVDSHNVPVPHFGVVLEWTRFHAFADRLKVKPGFKFEIAPTVRFKGLPGEQRNALEFKSFKDPSKLFATK
ncbi:hypothetical protein HK101_010455 [Irineochytrium annulatum]|nr:hypothetical protein HK101_010455 [Irineochytrium annulatum]